jgi:Lon protease-like protein
VFLFPLVNVTLFPQTTKPLHVFEARYLTMIKDSIATRTPVAVGFIEDPAKVEAFEVGQKVPFVRSVAGFGHPEIIEERLNGTLLVFVKGEGKVELGKVLDQPTPYAVCEALKIMEITDLHSKNQSHVEALHQILTRWIQQHIPDELQREIFMKNVRSTEEIIGSFAAYMVRDYDLQQMVLEFDDINDKVEFLFRLTESNELSNI